MRNERWLVMLVSEGCCSNAPVTGWLQIIEMYSLTFLRPEVQDEGICRAMVSLNILGKDLVCTFLLASVVSSNHCCCVVYRLTAPISASNTMRSFPCLWVCPSPCPLSSCYKDTSHKIKGPPYSRMTSSKHISVTSTNSISNKATFTGASGENFTISFWGTQSNHTVGRGISTQKCVTDNWKVLEEEGWVLAESPSSQLAPPHSCWADPC